MTQFPKENVAIHRFNYLLAQNIFITAIERCTEFVWKDSEELRIAIDNKKVKIEMVTTPTAGAILYVFFRGKYILPASILRHDLVQGNAIYQLLQLKTPKN